MLEIKPMTSNDHFVHPVQAVKSVDSQSSPFPTGAIIAKMTREAKPWTPGVGIRRLATADALKQKIKELLFR